MESTRAWLLAVPLLCLCACKEKSGQAADRSTVLVGAGDIANCDEQTDEATADLLDDIQGIVFTLGDNAYPSGTREDLERCYTPTWGRHRQRTRPAPGNHDYLTEEARPYFEYFGVAAGEPGKGYYSYDVGAWHVVVLNSELSVSAGSPQEKWLREDLASHPRRCTLAYWHRPRFSSGMHGNNDAFQPFWEALYEAGAEVVLGGHEHHYERFAPQTPQGAADPARGLRQFIVGTGGGYLYALGPQRAAHSEAIDNTTYGVLKLTLEENGYTWEFLPAQGSFTDKGRGTCH